MKTKTIFLFVIISVLLMTELSAQNFLTDSYYQNYHKYKEEAIKSKRFTNADILPLIEKLKSNNLFEVTKLGESLLGKDIYQLKIGNGKTKILAWSQMHGDESTATMALFDLFNFLKADDDFNKLRELLFENLTIYFIPMLNPDGAEIFTRRNAGMVDLNRDAARLQFPESKILKKVRDELEPEFGFNLHDQSSYYTAGNNFKTATISFLAPAYNYEKEINEVRSNTMKVIVDLNNELSKIIPGHIGRYSDDFEPRAFGDNLVKWGTSSVLIESGGWKDDAEKQFIRKLNFISLLVAFESIAKGNYNSNNIDYYFAIPQNERLLYDVILRNALIEIHGKEFLMDVAINRNERINRNGEKTYYSSISELGDLSIFYGYEEYDLSNMKLEPGKIYKDDYYHELEKEDLTELLNDGFTDFLSDTLYVKEIDLRKTKVNLFTDKERKSTNEIRLFRNANFVVKKDDQVKYLFINGFLVNPKVDFTTVENGLLID
ncbi:MAG: peptidase M14 [Ignavibacteriae bacterium]|nr:peptidase M14 [Ignavibacteriota bacterium]